jgi:RNA polymerase sigma factor (sigma-70 family)
MMTTNIMPVAANNDAELVSGTLAGNCDAFSHIVSRYQSLICSLAYSATGSLGQSEDLAQETFITAWKHLGHLRERHKLRAWLCGIARNRINNFLRREGREPIREAEPLENVSESHSPEPLPCDHTISNEEQAILWRSLERIPPIYREPLVLFYREHQSIEAVAQNLELSEDAVKQRLSRGRKLLHEEVLAFVEGALEKTSPGKTFTLGVISALPLAVTSAKAATVGAALAKGGAAAKGVATVGTLGGLLAMLGGAFVTFKAQVDDSKSPRERQFMLQGLGWQRTFVLLLFLAVFFAATRFDYIRTPIHFEFFVSAFVFCFGVYSMVMIDRRFRRRLQIQIEDNTFVEAEWTMPRKVTDADTAAAKSKARSRVARFMALGIGMLVFVVTQESWKQHLGHAILVTAFMALMVVRGFLQWQNYPRFISLRSAWFVYVPVLMCLLTLFFFNYHQYLARTSSDISRIASPAEFFTFNFAVVLANAVFTGIIAWKRKIELQSTPSKLI